MRVFKVFFGITAALMLNCQQQPTNLKPGIITLGVIPENGGTISTNVSSFQAGDHIILEATPGPGRVFFKWQGTSVSYNPIAEFDVTTQYREYIAVFPLAILVIARFLLHVRNYE